MTRKTPLQWEENPEQYKHGDNELNTLKTWWCVQSQCWQAGKVELEGFLVCRLA